MRPATFFHRRAARFVAVFGLIMLGLLATGPGQTAWAQTTTTCSPAQIKGADGPIDYGAYCWFKFTPQIVASAQNGGQYVQVDLIGGAYLTFTLKITGGNTAPATVPSYSGAAFGHSAFNNINDSLGQPIAPILYQTADNTTTSITLTNVTLHANGTTDLPFVFVAADGESTNQNESLEFNATGATWTLASAPGISDYPNRQMPTLNPLVNVGDSTGSQTVTETGTPEGPDGEGSYVFTTSTNPGTVTATIDGGGKQGVLFGVKYHTIGLSLIKSHDPNVKFKVGGTGSYTIKVTNTVKPPAINPPSDPQPVEVEDTLPDGLTYASASGSGWTCSNVDQVVTCKTTSLLTANKTFPPITVNVNVANDAPASLTNNATVTDPTTSTLVFNVCKTANNGVCPNSATSTDGDATTILHPDLSTSTKTVLDKNGGDAQPGDVLEYTVTLTESGGLAASNISVTDDMPAHVGSLTVTNNAGGTDSSTTSGGVNDTGKLDINNITVPANGSKTIVYDVTIDAGTAPGTTIDNTATIDNPNGPGATPAADQILVSLSQVPASGNKILYVYDNESLTRTPQAGGGGGGGGGVTVPSDNNSSPHIDWTLTPPLAKELTVIGDSGSNSSPAVSVNLMVECANQHSHGGGETCQNDGDLEFTATLYDKIGGSLTAVGSTSTDTTYNFTKFTQATANISVPSSYTFVAGHQLVLRITNTTGKKNRDLRVEQYTGAVKTQFSYVNINVSTVINVDSVGVYDDANCSNELTTPVPVYETNSKVYLCAVVSDPFGSNDIDPGGVGQSPFPVTITIKDAHGTQKINAAPMTQVADSGAATKTFRYTYTVPTSPPPPPLPSAILALGNWTASVTAWEGTEYTINDIGIGTFDVEAPDLVIVKSVTAFNDPVEDTPKAKALPGATMRYAIQITNQGKGPVDSGHLTVTDAIPAHTAFVVGNFTGAGAGSGVNALTASDVSYSDDGGSTWTYTPAASGTDPAVTNIRFKPGGSMKGKTGSTAPAYTITFDVKIK